MAPTWERHAALLDGDDDVIEEDAFSTPPPSPCAPVEEKTQCARRLPLLPLFFAPNVTEHFDPIPRPEQNFLKLFELGKQLIMT